MEKLADGEFKLCGRVGLLEELTASHKGVRHQSGQGCPGCIENPQARSQRDGLICDIVSTKGQRDQANIDKKRVNRLGGR